jgi:acyl-CoA thioesterase FadM
MQYLNSLGYTELDVDGIGLIMADVAIEFKKELYYGDIIRASVTIAEISRIGFELFYKLETSTDALSPAVIAKTCMICYDYEKKKVVSLPESVKKKLTS